MDESIGPATKKAVELKRLLETSSKPLPEGLLPFCENSAFYDSIDRQKCESVRLSFGLCALVLDGYINVIKAGAEVEDGTNLSLKLACEAVETIIRNIYRFAFHIARILVLC